MGELGSFPRHPGVLSAIFTKPDFDDTYTYVSKPRKMGPISPFVEIKLAIGHKSSRNAENNAKNKKFISKTVIF